MLVLPSIEAWCCPISLQQSFAVNQLIVAALIPAVMLFIFASAIINATEARTMAWVELGVGYALAVATLLTSMPAASEVAFVALSEKHRILHADDKGLEDACAVAANSVTWRFALTYLIVAYISSISIFPSFGLPSTFCHSFGAVAASAVAFLFRNVIARTSV